MVPSLSVCLSPLGTFKRRRKITRRRAEDEKKLHLKRSRAELVAPATLCNFRKVVDQPLKYVCSIQVTVVVHVDVHHTLSIWGEKTPHGRAREQ